MTLRELLINWLTGSRFIQSLEQRIAEQRQDMTERLADKDSQIKLLRTKIAGLKLECDRMRAVLLPFGSSAGAEYAQRYDANEPKPAIVPVFEGPDDWQSELNKMYQKQEEANVQVERREGLHESTADDGA